jgi:glycosyltransferase involved in cell wall biosynthesis
MNVEYPLISVIVPVYNVSPYLTECLDSLVNQKFSPIEIIVVDDGSTDDSGVIAESFSRKYNNIKLYHKENGGLSDARNFGIRHSSGGYIVFVDSDDFVSSYYIGNLYNTIVVGDSDLAITSLYYFEDGSSKASDQLRKTKESNELVKKVSYFDSESALENMLNMRGIESNAFGKIYKRVLFDEIEYPVGKLYEDIATTSRLLDKAQRIAFAPYCDYFYRKRKNSIQTSNFSYKQLDLLDQIEDIRKIVKAKYPMLLPAVLSKYQSALFNLWMKIDSGDLVHKSIEEKLWKQICDNRIPIIRDKTARTDARFASLLTYGGKAFVRLIYRLSRGTVNYQS